MGAADKIQRDLLRLRLKATAAMHAEVAVKGPSAPIRKAFAESALLMMEAHDALSAEAGEG